MSRDTLCNASGCCLFRNGSLEVQSYDASEILEHNGSLPETQLLAENTEESLYGAEPEMVDSAPKSGDLVIPGTQETKAKEKQCVTVCDKWGENCVINPRTGQKKCRRMCQSFGQECL